MTATNHALTGAVIVAAVSNPVISLPLALLSHFVLDSLPHFGAHTVAQPGKREFNAILMTDGLLLLSLLIVLVIAGRSVDLTWWLLPLGGMLGAAPDIMWAQHYQDDIKGNTKQWGFVRTFHKQIQRWERSWGWIVEALWFVCFVIVLNQLLFST